MRITRSLVSGLRMSRSTSKAPVLEEFGRLWALYTTLRVNTRITGYGTLRENWIMTLQNISQSTTIKSISSAIDWISVTCDHSSIRRSGINMVYNYFADDAWAECRASNGYTLAHKNDVGIVQMVNLQRYDMGTHIIYSGKTLRKIESTTEKTSMDILRYHIENKDNLRRLDIAIDVWNYGLSIDELAVSWACGDAVSRARTCTEIRDVDGKHGHTLYIGSRKRRKKLLRIYDKASEQGIDADWIRIELQVMGSPIGDVYQALDDAHDITSVILGTIRGYCDFPRVALWRDIFDNPAIAVSSIPVHEGDTRTWILKQCLPAIARECRLDIHFWEQFQLALSYEIGEGTENV